MQSHAGKYKLEKLLSYDVDDAKAKAKFDKNKQQLEITFPVIPSPLASFVGHDPKPQENHISEATAPCAPFSSAVKDSPCSVQDTAASMAPEHGGGPEPAHTPPHGKKLVETGNEDVLHGDTNIANPVHEKWQAVMQQHDTELEKKIVTAPHGEAAGVPCVLNTSHATDAKLAHFNSLRLLTA